MALQAGAVPVKLGYIRPKLNRIDVYVAYSLLIAGTVLCPISSPPHHFTAREDMNSIN